MSLPVEDGAARNPAEPSGRGDRSAAAPGNPNAAVQQVIEIAKEIAPIPVVAQTRTSAGDRLARAGQPGAPGACPRLAGNRLAPLRASADGHRDGRMLFVAPLHSHGRGRQHSAHPVGPDRRRRVLAPSPGRGWRIDRTGRRLAPRLPGTRRPLVRVLPGPRGREVRHRRAGSRHRLRHRGPLGRAGKLARRPGGPQHRRGRSVAAVRAQVDRAAFG